MSMREGINRLAQKLLGRIYTTETLKLISATLEDMAQNKSFKLHAHAIASDKTLSTAQKRTQLLYLIRSVEEPLLYDFFSDELNDEKLWLFVNDEIDYFDKFVQEFQLSTKDIAVLSLTTARDLEAKKIKAMVTDLSKVFGKKVMIKHEVNPAILGGAQVKFGNMIYDMSLRSKFQQFQHEWLTSIKQTEARLGVHQTGPNQT